MKKIVLATGNKNKVKELIAIMLQHPEFQGVEISSMTDEGLDFEIEETGSTYEENAAIKAKAACEKTGKIAMADDSGMEIECLNGEPGLYSARYLGENTSYHEKIVDIIRRMEGSDNRRCRYVCAIAMAFPDGRLLTVRGEIEGEVAEKEAGENGFSYDPIFLLPEIGKTYAQLSFEEKTRCSHRSRAVEKISKKIFSKSVTL